MKLPDFLVKAIEDNTTSLGTHPAFPPEEEETFVGALLKNEYNSTMEALGMGNVSPKEIANTLKRLVSECQKIEEPNREALEKLCSDTCAKIFEIPEDTINLDVKLIGEDGCDMSKYRMLPEPTPDFSFEDIEEMKYLTDEVYKRRMLDALITGASMYYANNLEFYIKEVYQIDPRLVGLYAEIIKYNKALLYNQADTIKNIERNNGGKVDVLIGNVGERISIKAEGVIFPVLLDFAIKGLLETATQNGLPDDEEKAKYILCKADYRLAENWDMRLGIPLWRILVDNIKKCDIPLEDVGANFILMELSKLSPDTFNMYLQNAFKKTVKGIEMTYQMSKNILYNKEKDQFDNFIKVQNDKYAINDNTEYYTPEELLNEVD